jgi:lipoate-protein ligase B
MERLRNTGAELIHTDRGGLTTFHGPGQLVVYPVLDLGKFRKMTLRNYVETLEHVAIHTCRLLGVPAKKSLESVSHTGAWVNDKKICAIGNNHNN